MAHLKGDVLGMLTDEVQAGTKIVEVVTVAPKCYALKMVNAKGEITYSIKAKGMTLNGATLQSVSFDTMKKMMKDHIADKAVVPLHGREIQFTKGTKRALDRPHTRFSRRRGCGRSRIRAC
ncbi:hypothetical protein CRE_06906 [Caenorhabditis remanei]|uniref:Uncharacterized protein n=1 Tax=Caenorhabditis remanei TaxID=31234 RepID=E3MZJ8_CAERE|nr:hypothetical protein CRE_06906 [Caenorhabditis remanei]